jgi:hypothetical protein
MASLGAGTMIELLVADLDGFAAGQEPPDDQTLLVFQLNQM